MTFRQVFFIVLSICLLTGCRRGYKIENQKVYYEYWNEASGQGKRLIEEADAKSFQKVEFNCDCNFAFGKDKKHIFMDGIPMKNIDPSTFKFIGNYIFADKNSAYFFGFYNSLNDCVIKGINPYKIELLTYPWAKAGNLLIHGRDTVYLEDINEFIPIDEDWGKTKKQIVNNNDIVYGVDIESFKVINGSEGKDKNYNYQYGTIKSDEFVETSFQSFDFKNLKLCNKKPLEFTDIYNDSQAYINDPNQRIELVEKCKANGYAVTTIRQSNFGGSKIISVTLKNNNCSCYVEKYYKFDYSQPADTGKVYKVTERIHCLSK